MRLKKINGRIYVNAGVGNITSVIGGRGLGGDHWTAINFLGGKQLDLPGQKIEDVVASLQETTA